MTRPLKTSKTLSIYINLMNHLNEAYLTRADEWSFVHLQLKAIFLNSSWILRTEKKKMIANDEVQKWQKCWDTSNILSIHINSMTQWNEANLTRAFKWSFVYLQLKAASRKSSWMLRNENKRMMQKLLIRSKLQNVLNPYKFNDSFK